jgi:hypothetical protein
MPKVILRPVADTITRDDAVLQLKQQIGGLAAKIVQASDPGDVAGDVTELIKACDAWGNLRDVVLRQYIRDGWGPTSLASKYGNRFSKSTVTKACRG